MSEFHARPQLAYVVCHSLAASGLSGGRDEKRIACKLRFRCALICLGWTAFLTATDDGKRPKAKLGQVVKRDRCRRLACYANAEIGAR